MRGMLETINPTELATILTNTFETEIKNIVDEEDEANHQHNNNNNNTNNNKKKGTPSNIETLSISSEEKDGITYVPTNLCYKVLNKIPNIRLNKMQLIALLSWADCFEEGGSGVDYRAFARYASDIISKMGKVAELEKRAQAVNHINKLDERKLVGNLSPSLVESYLQKRFTDAEDLKGNVNEVLFIEVLMGIPEAKLTSKEAAAITAIIPHDADKSIHWREFLPWAYHTIRELCEERMIGRRMTLFAASTPDGDLLPLEHFAQRLVGFMKLKQILGKPVITFPTDEMNDKESRRPTAQRILNSRPNSQSDRRSSPATPSTTRSGRRGSMKENIEKDILPTSFDLLRVARTIPIIEKGVRRGVVPMLLRISENDVIACPEKAPIQVRAVSCDLSINCTVPLTLRMPSIGMVDREAAQQFALNLVSKLYMKPNLKHVLEMHFAFSDEY